MSIKKVFLLALLFVVLTGCQGNESTSEETFNLYQVCDNEKVNDLLNNIPRMVSIGGGYPEIMWGDSLMEDLAEKFSKAFVELEVTKADSCNIEDLKHTIEFYWDEDESYTIYYTDDNIALIDNQAYKIIDISPIDVDWFEE